MKKKYLILSVFAIVFSACETDFDVNADWEETTVVFGLLDASKDIQFIKINKAFLGEADAYNMASISDSFNYNPEDIIVTLHKLTSSGDTIFLGNWPKNFRDTIINKAILIVNGDSIEPIFATDNNIIYYLKTPDGLTAYQSFNNPFSYVLTVENIKSGNIISSSTSLIGDFEFDDFTGLTGSIGNPGGPVLFPFYNFVNGENVGIKQFYWEDYSDEQAFNYQFCLKFNYNEDGGDTLSLLWQKPLLDKTVSNLAITGNGFFNFLENNLKDNGSERKFLSIEIEMTVGSQDLDTYRLINEEITGIVQQRPLFTNINNGIGLFSSRNSILISDLGLNLTTLDYLKSSDGLDRNFQ